MISKAYRGYVHFWPKFILLCASYIFCMQAFHLIMKNSGNLRFYACKYLVSYFPSLLFDIYLLKPASVLYFDEVDAPLDDANIDKFNNIIREFSHDSQFIIVTHNKRTMSSTDIIYGEPWFNRVYCAGCLLICRSWRILLSSSYQKTITNKKSTSITICSYNANKLK